MLEKSRVEEILVDSEVLMTGHFILTSGKHSDKYMQCAKIQQYPKYTAELCEAIAAEFKDIKIDAVVSPAVGAIIVGYELARQMGVRNLFTERENDKMVLRRGFEIPKNSNVIVVEDVTTTGGTVFEVMDFVREAGSNVVGVALLVDRSNGEIDFGVKTVAAYTTLVSAYDAADCPLCKEGKLEAYKPGSRKTV